MQESTTFIFKSVLSNEKSFLTEYREIRQRAIAVAKDLFREYGC